MDDTDGQNRFICCELSIVRERSLAAEKLAEHYGCTVTIADGLWPGRRHRLPSPHQPRRRHNCLGELVQIDGSGHAWFEVRGPAVHAAGFRGQCAEPVDAAAVRRDGINFDYF